MSEQNADSVPSEEYWACPDCGCWESVATAFCWRCGAGPPEPEDAQIDRYGAPS
jgi:hypothetical protein